MKYTLLIFITILALSGCQKQESHSEAISKNSEQQESPVELVKGTKNTTASLADILSNQPEEAKARYKYRHPKETIEFFRVKPGETIVEALPGGGWYSKILQAYLGAEGTLIGVDYNHDMWGNFSFVDDAFLEERKNWSIEWPNKAKEWASENGAKIEAYTFATLPADLSVDKVLFIRALHNLSRFNDKGAYLTNALKETHRILKPNGLVGVVQHHAPNDKTDEWANGSRGYLKKSVLVKQFELAGFSFIDESDVNANDKDNPGENDIVWRLPPTLGTSKDDEELKSQLVEIGESNRMTLLFKKSEVDSNDDD